MSNNYLRGLNPEQRRAGAWLFREKLNALLPLLQMKYKDLDVSFRLEKAEAEAATLPPPSPEQEEASKPTEEENSRFEQLAEMSPRAAVIDARLGVEEAVSHLAKLQNLTTSRMAGLLELTRLLRKHEIIDSHTSALLDDLRALGNKAAHDPDAPFRKEDAMRYRSLADQVIGQLKIAELV